MKNKKLIIILISTLIVLLLAGGIFAYLYIATDTFKPSNELFAKYINGATTDTVALLKNDDLANYMTKKSNTIYKNTGSMNLVDKSNEAEKTIKLLDFEGVVDNANKIVNENINLSYADAVNFPVKYARDNDKYALISSEVVNKYLAVENNGLKVFFQKLGIATSSMPDSINFDNIKTLEFSPNEINTLSNKYINIINAKLTKDNFVKDKTNTKQPGYILTIKGNQLKDIEKEVLTNLKTEETITSKLSDSMKQQYENKIDSMVTELETTNFDDEYLKVTVYKKINDITNIVVDTNSFKSNITCSANILTIKYTPNKTNTNTDNTNNTQNKENTTNTENASQAEDTVVTFQLNKTIKGTNNAYGVSFNISDSNNKNIMDIALNMEVDNPTLNDVNEGYSVEVNSDSIKSKIECINNVTFKDDLQTEKLTDDNSVVLNNYSQSDLQNILGQVILQINYVNSAKIQQAGQNAKGFMTEINKIITNAQNVYSKVTETL